jgi:CubicO group peptidase (beta-lactamase class C family)
MATLDAVTWHARLEEAVARHNIPGAVLGVAHRSERIEVAAGRLNLATESLVRPTSVFQLGSISKVYTALLVMQLVDGGRVSLDDSLAEVLPELDLADRRATARIRLRQLLSHSSGIDGDHIIDTGPGDDALARMVDASGQIRMLAPPGTTMSYCNIGFALAGRIVERLTGQVWEDALRDRLCAPAGLKSTAVRPEDLLRHEVAYGHVSGPNGSCELAPAWTPPRSLGPAGYVCASIGDVLDFAAIVLADGVAPNGNRVLSAAASHQMRTAEIAVPEPWLMGSHWGLGWALQDWQSHRAIGHFGDGIGHCAYLWIVPSLDLRFALMTNCKSSRAAFLELLNDVVREVAGVSVTSAPAPISDLDGADVTRHLGVYEREGMRHEVCAVDDGTLRLRSTPTGAMARWFGSPPSDLSLLPVDRSGSVFVDGVDESRTAAVFFDGPGGERFLHYGMRATPRVG